MTTIITTAASVTKLIQDVPNALADVVVNAVLSNRNISKGIVKESMYGFNYAVGNKFYNYGDSFYINGLPSGGVTHEFPENSNELILQAISNDFPSKDILSIDSVILGLPNNAYLFNEFFRNSEDWAVGILVVTEIATGIVYGLLNLTSELTNGNLYVKLNGVSTDDVRELNIPVNITPNTSLLQVIYSVQGAVFVEQHYWTYIPSNNRYDYLSFTMGATSLTQFYPIAPIRLGNVNIVDSPDYTELAESTGELLRRINIDLDKFSSDLTDPNNPTALDDVDDGFIMFAMNLDSDEDIAKSYLYEFFRTTYYTQEYDQQYWIDTENNEFIRKANNFLGLSDKRVNVNIRFKFITLEIKSGTLGDPHPTYDPMVLVPTSGNEIDPFSDGSGDISKTVQLGTESSEVVGGYTVTSNTHVLLIRKQLTTGPGATFVEMAIFGLEHSMLLAAGAFRVIRTLQSMDDGGFFIPISKGIVDKFGGTDEAYIYYESLVFLVYAVDETNLSWYQDPDFLNIFKMVLVVIAIASGMGGLTEAIAAGFEAFMVYIVESYLMTLVIQEALGALIDLVGGDVALILAAIAAGVALYYGKDVQITELLNADDLLKYATLTIEAVNTKNKEDFLELQQEQEEFYADAKELQEEIDAASDLLDGGGKIDLYALTDGSVYTDFNETPTDFYNRTIHLTNPGVLSLDTIENYVSGALRLPDAPSTI